MLIKLLVVLCVSCITVIASLDFLDSRIRPVQGEPYTLRISGCDEGCTLTIRSSGGSSTLPNGKEITNNARTPSHTFTLSGLLEGTYSLKLTNNVDNGVQFSTTFSLPDPTKPSTTTSSATSTTAPPKADSTDASDESSERSSSSKKKKKKKFKFKKLKPGALAGIVVGAVTALLGVLGACLRWREKKDGGKDNNKDGRPKQPAASSH